MLRVSYFKTNINRSLADALNQESGRAYSDALVRHWRVYRRHGHWLSRKAASKLQDAELGRPALLHSHSFDAAREGFYAACKTTRQCRKQDLDNKYPYKRKGFRPTAWKSSAIRLDGDTLLLSLHLYDEVGHIQPTEPKYRQPFRKVRPRHSPSDTGQVAAAGRYHASPQVGRSPSLQ